MRGVESFSSHHNTQGERESVTRIVRSADSITARGKTGQPRHLRPTDENCVSLRHANPLPVVSPFE